MIEADNLLLPLMVGSITAAGLTLAGGKFLVEYVEEHIENSVKALHDNLVPIHLLLLRLKKLTMATVLVFLFSEVLLIGYIAFSHKEVVYASYTFFFAAILLLFYSILTFLHLPSSVIFWKN
jgi:hypothetical protein